MATKNRSRRKWKNRENCRRDRRKSQKLLLQLIVVDHVSLSHRVLNIHIAGRRTHFVAASAKRVRIAAACDWMTRRRHVGCVASKLRSLKSYKKLWNSKWMNIKNTKFQYIPRRAIEYPVVHTLSLKPERLLLTGHSNSQLSKLQLTQDFTFMPHFLLGFSLSLAHHHRVWRKKRRKKKKK